jgi:hypothetical protein
MDVRMKDVTFNVTFNLPPLFFLLSLIAKKIKEGKLKVTLKEELLTLNKTKKGLKKNKILKKAFR